MGSEERKGHESGYTEETKTSSEFVGINKEQKTRSNAADGEIIKETCDR